MLVLHLMLVISPKKEEKKAFLTLLADLDGSVPGGSHENADSKINNLIYSMTVIFKTI